MEWSPPMESWADNPLGDVLFAFADPGDFGSAALIDARTGALLFAASVVWMGTGQHFCPAVMDDMATLADSGEAGPPPAVFNELNLWEDRGCFVVEGDERKEIDCLSGQAAFDAISSYGPVRDLAVCGQYSVLAYMHPLTVGMLDPSTAEWVVVVTGLPSLEMLGCTQESCPPLTTCDGQVCQVGGEPEIEPESE